MALTAQMISVDCADPVRLATCRTEAAGYDLRWQHGPGPGRRVLADPEGNEFRVSAHG